EGYPARGIAGGTVRGRQNGNRYDHRLSNRVCPRGRGNGLPQSTRGRAHGEGPYAPRVRPPSVYPCIPRFLPLPERGWRLPTHAAAHALRTARRSRPCPLAHVELIAISGGNVCPQTSALRAPSDP